MCGAARIFYPEGQCLASRGFAEYTVILRDGIFYPHKHSCLILSLAYLSISNVFILKAAFITIYDVDFLKFEVTVTSQ